MLIFVPVSNFLSFLRFLLGPTIDEIIVDALNYGDIIIKGLAGETDSEDEESDTEEADTLSSLTYSERSTLKSSQMSERSSQYSERLSKSPSKVGRRGIVESSLTTGSRSIRSGSADFSISSGRRNSSVNFQGSNRKRTNSPRNVPSEASGDKPKGSLKISAKPTKSGAKVKASAKIKSGKKSKSPQPPKGSKPSKVSFKEATGESGEGYGETGSEDEASYSARSRSGRSVKST